MNSSDIAPNRYAMVLRWLELQALKQNYAPLQKSYRGLSDGWWLAVEGGEPSGPYPFREVLEHLLDGDSPLLVVHESVANHEPTPWITLKCHPYWRDPKAVRWFRIIVIAVGILVAWCIFQSVVPWQLRQWGADWIFWVGVIGVFLRFRFRRGKCALSSQTDSSLSSKSDEASKPDEVNKESAAVLEAQTQ